MRYGMVIDLQQCVGCGACAFACKSENNTQERHDGQTHNWADFAFQQEGKFPDLRYTAMPVLCNHCTNAPCVEACPVEPKAMYKSSEGLTVHNEDRCVGCQMCQRACPYSETDVAKSDMDYSVISFAEEADEQYVSFKETEPLIPGCTASGAEIARRTEEMPPWRTKFKSPDNGSVRRAGVTEKCTFCAHRLADGLQPACVEACPAGARVFGDLSDPQSEPSKHLAQHQATSFRLKEKEGTEPAVYYVRDFGVAKR
jgi:Fe-S-cluster-containing dehydrogenase component